ncbi:MAG TPA: succinate dehydrogenase assembly factor 2 [Gammaproteobacteria bacterium]|nr:succinate dehydrogenase assembly factor 2 [Gammaproteobacteria bacterium]
MSELNRLRWLCRRGMKELDIVLLHYLDRHYARAGAAERLAFARLLEMQDPDIHALLLGRSFTKDTEISDVIAILRQSRD